MGNGVTAWKYEVSFRREYPAVWWMTPVGPFVATGGILFVVWELSGSNVVWRLVSTVAGTFFLFGKFVILGGSGGDLLDARAFFAAEQLVVLVLYMDVMTACVLALLPVIEMEHCRQQAAHVFSGRWM